MKKRQLILLSIIFTLIALSLGRFSFAAKDKPAPPPDNPGSGFIFCQTENQGACTFIGRTTVRFGAGNDWRQWTSTTVGDGSIDCTTGAFGGDPYPKWTKRCYKNTPQQIILYGDPNRNGSPLVTVYPYARTNLSQVGLGFGNWNDIVSSFQVVGGCWNVCNGADGNDCTSFGPDVIINGLPNNGILDNAISSVYPYGICPTCSFPNMTDWSPSTCPDSGIQTRELGAPSPRGCTLVGALPPVVSACTPGCRSFTYYNWEPSLCPANGQQTRQVKSSTPANCSGGVSPVLSQSCTPACSGVPSNPSNSPYLTGSGWSDNIGGIDFAPACSRVFFDSTTGKLTGYAWSENIGWIKFGGLDAIGIGSVFPSGSSTVSKDAYINSSNKLVGWARACTGTKKGDCSTMESRTDGWDGWISLNGDNYGVSFSSVTQRFSGYAWGSDVVGWINFIDVSLIGMDEPVVEPTIDIYTNGEVIKWESTELATCSYTKDGGAKQQLPDSKGGTVPSTPEDFSEGATYVLTCIINGEEYKDTLVILPSVKSICAPSQKDNLQGDTNIYVNRNTTWTMTNEGGTFGSVEWSGKDMATRTSEGSTTEKIYTTVGQKFINAKTIVKRKDNSTFSATCYATTTVKLDTGEHGEI